MSPISHRKGFSIFSCALLFLFFAQGDLHDPESAPRIFLALMSPVEIGALVAVMVIHYGIAIARDGERKQGEKPDSLFKAGQTPWWRCLHR